mgnify:CR=1 FL=1
MWLHVVTIIALVLFLSSSMLYSVYADIIAQTGHNISLNTTGEKSAKQKGHATTNERFGN